MAAPVYLFTGFLDSGKTTLIKDTMNDEQFMEGAGRTLILCFEQVIAQLSHIVREIGQIRRRISVFQQMLVLGFHITGAGAVRNDKRRKLQ